VATFLPELSPAGITNQLPRLRRLGILSRVFL
jgi:hypothetical protein